LSTVIDATSGTPATAGANVAGVSVRRGPPLVPLVPVSKAPAVPAGIAG
jgi:hypothetical protein